MEIVDVWLLKEIPVELTSTFPPTTFICQHRSFIVDRAIYPRLIDRCAYGWSRSMRSQTDLLRVDIDHSPCPFNISPGTIPHQGPPRPSSPVYGYHSSLRPMHSSSISGVSVPSLDPSRPDA